LALRALTVRNNTAAGNSGGPAGEGEFPGSPGGGGTALGGGLALTYAGIDESPAEIVGGRISGNHAIGANVIAGSTSGTSVSAGDGRGGGIWVGSGSLLINKSSIDGNFAVGGNGDASPGTLSTPGSGEGGGMFNAGAAVTLVAAGVHENRAVAGEWDGAFGGAAGGAFGGVRPTIEGCSVHSNFIVFGNTETPDN
jgi:hypothetical protein